jgi:hypothetical protein
MKIGQKVTFKDGSQDKGTIAKLDGQYCLVIRIYKNGKAQRHWYSVDEITEDC